MYIYCLKQFRWACERELRTCAFVCEHLCVHAWACVYTQEHLCAFRSMHRFRACMRVRAFVPMFVRICLYACVYEGVCSRVHLHVSACVHVSLHKRIRVCMCMRVRMCLYICYCVSLCTCMLAYVRSPLILIQVMNIQEKEFIMIICHWSTVA